MHGPSPDDDYSRRNDAREMLATSLIKQRKLSDAERIVLSFIEDTPEKDIRALQSTYSLAEIYLEVGQFDKAESYCQKILKEADQMFGRTHPLFQQSAKLLLEIYRNKGDFIALQAYRSAILPGRIVRGGFTWQKAIALLNNNGFSLEGMDQQRKANALRWATEKGLENVVLVLLETKDGIKDVVNWKDRIGKTALHYTSAYGHASIASILLQNGANIETRAACSMTSLHLAAHYNEVEVVRVLLDNGADINSKTNDDKTALHNAVESNSVRVVQLMLSRNADIEATDEKKWTPIFWGCKKDRVDAIRLLLLHRANIMARDIEGKTPLHWAAWYGHVALVQLLIAHGADVAAQGVSGGDPLRSATINGRLDIVLILLNYGAPMGLKHNSGMTALHEAAKRGNLAIVRLLVEAGANAWSCDRKGYTVLDVARKSKHDVVYQYLSANSGMRG